MSGKQFAFLELGCEGKNCPLEVPPSAVWKRIEETVLSDPRGLSSAQQVWKGFWLIFPECV